MSYQRILVAVAALLALVGVSILGLPAQASPPTQANLLENPGFEDPYAPYQGDSTRLVAHGWTPWHVPQREGDEGFRNLKPEYQPASASNPDRILEGSNAQEYFSFFATHTGGVYQQVSVPAGSRVQFSVYVYVWSTRFDDVNRSEDPGRVQVQVGIDPNGGTDGESDTIIWSLPLEYYDEYRQVSVEADANNDVITAFVRTSFDLPQKNNNVYLDQASLTVSGAVSPTDTPTDIPAATHTPTATVMVTATATATVPSAVTPSPTPTSASGQLPTPTQDEFPDQPTATPTQPYTGEIPAQVLHRAVAGDTVGALAQRYGSTVEAIIQANGLNSDALIYVGQELIIPVREAPTPTPYPTPLLTQVGIIPTNTPVGAAPTSTPVPGTGGPTQPTGTYIVQRGDTLTHIAARYNVTVATLVQLNGIVNPNLIRAGQTLIVPLQAQPAPPPPPQPRIHVVARGENLFRISLRYGVPLPELARVNNIFDPNRIYVGQVLTIP